MKEYEAMYIVKPLSDEELDKVVKAINSVIDNNEGHVIKTDWWGKKRLCYSIQDSDEGVYFLVTFEATPNCVQELDRKLRINDNVFRHLIISKGC